MREPRPNFSAMTTSLFHRALLKALADNWHNDHTDNFDHVRFGEQEQGIVDPQRGLSDVERYLEELEAFFCLLGDDRSRGLLIQLLAFRILGHRKIRLPLSRPEYWKAIADLALLMERGKSIKTTLLRNTTDLFYADLSPLGIPVRLYTLPRTILTQFLLNQYLYKKDDGSIIGAEPGDIVIDGGACWGDTSLCFAHMVRGKGKVYAFEFIPDNLKVTYENIRLNPAQEEIVRVVEHPLWHESGIRMYHDDKGPGSRVSAEPMEGCAGEATTLCIDDLVRQEGLKSVDLIKMDIEGAEQDALRGAEQTLRRFRPKLAISIYHSMSDFAQIVHQIHEMDLGYLFYLNHFTIHYEETVLYAHV